MNVKTTINHFVFFSSCGVAIFRTVDNSSNFQNTFKENRNEVINGSLML